MYSTGCLTVPGTSPSHIAYFISIPAVMPRPEEGRLCSEAGEAGEAGEAPCSRDPSCPLVAATELYLQLIRAQQPGISVAARQAAANYNQTGRKNSLQQPRQWRERTAQLPGLSCS